MEETRQAQLDRLYQAHAETILTYEVSAALDRPVFGRGPLDAVLMLIGEAPGAQEAEQGYPFVGKAGQQLNALLEAISLDREALFVTNAVKYRPIKPGCRANRSPSRKEIDAGRELLGKEVELVKPRMIATLGNSPLYALTGDVKLRIGDCHGRFIEGASMGAYRIFPLYHPASLIYNPSLRTVMEADLQALRQVMFDNGL